MNLDEELAKYGYEHPNSGLSTISQFIFTSKYARFLPDLKRRETWNECIDRVLQMHLRKYSFLSESEKNEVRWAFSLVREKKVLPSMRSMQFGGPAIEAKNAKIYNCCVRHIDSIRAFAEIFFLMLCGTGTGFGLYKQFTSRLPDLVDESDKNGVIVSYTIADTIEGWADSLEALLLCYHKNTVLSGRKIVFDYSKIRKRGTLLKTSGGRAPGYKALKAAHIKIKKLLDYIIEDKKQTHLSSLDIYDVLMVAADAVLSGGVRRTASIALFDEDDSEMLNAKVNYKVRKFRNSLDEETNTQHCRIWIDGDSRYYDVDFDLNKSGDKWAFENDLLKDSTISWFYTHPQRARSNNSIRLIKGKFTKEKLIECVERTKKYGEPGFYFGTEISLANPCQPTGALVLTPEGEKTLGEIKIGHKIASCDGWTTVIAKWSTGLNKTYKYKTKSGKIFYGTKTHKIVSNGHLVEVDDATHIDIAQWCHLTPPDDGIALNTYTEPSEIISREPCGLEETFDITVDNSSHTYWTNDCNVSNCVEINFEPVTTDGVCGVQFCNLVTLNATTCSSIDDFRDRVKAQTIIGTLQAGYTDFTYLNKTAKELTEEESLLGNSITGILDNPEIFLNEKYLEEMSTYAVVVNEEWAAKIGIKPAARICCNKPDGTSSLCIGTSSGIHPHHAERYFRRVQMSWDDNVLRLLQKENPHMVETSVWNSAGTDMVVTFPIVVRPDAIFKENLTAIEHMEIIKKYQKYWVIPSQKHNKKPINHSVSCTVIVKDSEWPAVIDYLYENQEYFSAISFLPEMGDKIYQQAPLEKVSTDEDKQKFLDLISNYKPVDYSKMVESEDNTDHKAEQACAGGKCEVNV